MKILKLKNAILILRVDPKKDEAKCLLIFFISWLNWTKNKQVFNLNEMSLSLVKDFYTKLANDWTTKYRIN